MWIRKKKAKKTERETSAHWGGEGRKGGEGGGGGAEGKENTMGQHRKQGLEKASGRLPGGQRNESAPSPLPPSPPLSLRSPFFCFDNVRNFFFSLSPEFPPLFPLLFLYPLSFHSLSVKQNRTVFFLFFFAFSSSFLCNPSPSPLFVLPPVGEGGGGWKEVEWGGGGRGGRKGGLPEWRFIFFPRLL